MPTPGNQHPSRELGSNDSLTNLFSVWTLCFPCCFKALPKPQPTFPDQYNGATEFLVEKLLITRVPLALFAIDEDLEADHTDNYTDPSSRTAPKSQLTEQQFEVRSLEARPSLHRKDSYISNRDRQVDKAYFLGFGKNPPPEENELRRYRAPAPTPESHMDKLDSDRVGQRHNPGFLIKAMGANQGVKVPNPMREPEISPDFLNKYSSIFVENFKDPIPKDPNPLNKSNIYHKKPLNLPKNWKKKHGGEGLYNYRDQPEMVYKMSSVSPSRSSDEEEEQQERVVYPYDSDTSSDESGSSTLVRELAGKRIYDPTDYARRPPVIRRVGVSNTCTMSKPEKVDKAAKRKKQSLRWKIIIRHRKPPIKQTGTSTHNQDTAND